jgi:hypothetical protein
MYQEISLWTLICTVTRMSDAPRTSGRQSSLLPKGRYKVGSYQVPLLTAS